MELFDFAHSWLVVHVIYAHALSDEGSAVVVLGEKTLVFKVVKGFP